jgi:hypothetical protein
MGKNQLDMTAFHPLLLAYADAQSALERIEERRKLSPVRRPWRNRCIIAERQALARIDKAPLDDDAFRIDGRGTVSTHAYDLTHWSRAIGAPIDLMTIQTKPRALLRWLGALDGNDRPSPLLPIQMADAMVDAVEMWQRDVKALPSSPPLLHSAQLARLWLQRSPIGRGDDVAALLIGDRWGAGRLLGSAGGLVALGLDSLGAPWRLASLDEFVSLWLHAITAAARHHLDLEVRLRAYAIRAAGHVEARRRPGALKHLLLLAMAHPLINSGSVARHLGLTSAGAIKLLTIATDLGLLIERSGQASYRSYAIPVTPPSIVPGARDNTALDMGKDFWETIDADMPLAADIDRSPGDSENT